MSDFTPTEQTLRSVWWKERWDQKGQLRFEGSDAEFDRFIARIKAEAWDEGWSAGYTDAVDDEHPQATGRHEPNPHRIEGEA